MMARIIYAMVDRVTLDIMDIRGTEIYQEYLEEFISIIMRYLFEEE